MATAAHLLEAARSELGYVESPAGSNRTKFAAEAGHGQGQPWCATFIVAMARRVGLVLPSESAYTPTMAAGFRSAGRWHPTPAPGDLAFFDFPDAKPRIQHVGVVESSTASYVTSIEANTSPGTAGSQDNGGGVYRRRRTRAHVVGYGRPAFSAPSPSWKWTDWMPKPTDFTSSCNDPRSGGFWEQTAEGGVNGHAGAMVYESYKDHAPALGGPRLFTSIVASPAGGFIQITNDGLHYRWDPPS